jgi:uncharacterized membrane protein YgcG
MELMAMSCEVKAMRTKLFLIAPSLALLAGCTPIDTGLGDALHHDIALQVLDPDPQYAGDEIEGGSGQRAADANKRYREGKVTPPVTIRTNSGGGGGGSSGSGSGGSSGGGGGGSPN